MSELFGGLSGPTMGLPGVVPHDDPPVTTPPTRCRGGWGSALDDQVIRLIRAARLIGRPGLVDLEIGADGRLTRVCPTGQSARQAASLEARGQVVTSGLWDEHVHFSQWAQQSTRLDLGDARDADTALQRLAAALGSREWAPALGPAEPADGAELIAVGVRGADWPGALGRARLDQVAGARPVVLVGADQHSAWLNTAGLRRHGLDETGDGHLVEQDCFRLVRDLDQLDDRQVDALVVTAARAAAARGVVGIVDFEMRWGIGDWARRRAAGFDLVRVEAAIYPDDLDRALQAGWASGQAVDQDGLVRVGPLKVISDGSLGTRTAWCCQPYPGGDHGRSLVGTDELRDLVRRARAGGISAAIHAIGDRANARALDVFADLGCGGRIEHAQLLGESDIARFAVLGVTASVQPEHLLDDQASADAVWPGRAAQTFPLASLHQAGARLVFGSDAPVAPLDPWRAVAAAVTRARPGQPAWTPEQRLPVEVALACSMRGPLRPGPGGPADLVLVEADPLTVSPEDLATLPVAATLVAGRLTHRAV